MGLGGSPASGTFSVRWSGSIDGIIEKGVPEAPTKRHILECKTHSLKSFKDLCDKGVQESKPQHWCQMQLYMHGTGIDRALYFAVCFPLTQLSLWLERRTARRGART